MPKHLEFSITYHDDNLLFLHDVLHALCKANIKTENILFRASEEEDLERIYTYGTDRGGFEPSMLWEKSIETGRNILHENVIFATDEADIRRGETEVTYQNSFKKFSIIERPLLLIYDAHQFEPVAEKQYLFKDTKDKSQALLAIFHVKKSRKTYEDGLH